MLSADFCRLVTDNCNERVALLSINAWRFSCLLEPSSVTFNHYQFNYRSFCLSLPIYSKLTKKITNLKFWKSIKFFWVFKKSGEKKNVVDKKQVVLIDFLLSRFETWNLAGKKCGQKKFLRSEDDSKVFTTDAKSAWF